MLSQLWFSGKRCKLYNVLIPAKSSLTFRASKPLIRWTVGEASIVEKKSSPGGDKEEKRDYPDKHVTFIEQDEQVEYTYMNCLDRQMREIVVEFESNIPRYSEEVGIDY